MLPSEGNLSYPVLRTCISRTWVISLSLDKITHLLQVPLRVGGAWLRLAHQTPRWSWLGSEMSCQGLSLIQEAPGQNGLGEGFGYKKLKLEWGRSYRSLCWCDWEQTMPVVCRLQLWVVFLFISHLQKERKNCVKQVKRVQGGSGTSRDWECPVLRVALLVPTARAAQAALLAEGYLPFCPSNPAKQRYVWAALLQKREKNNHPTTAGASLLLSHIAAVAMAAVITVGGCSVGPPPPRLLFPLPQEHQAAPMEASVAGSFTAFPGEHLVSPHPGLSIVSQPFCWLLPAPHNSGTIGCSYCTGCRVTSWPLGTVLCVSLLSMFFHLARVKAFCRVTAFLWPFQLQRTNLLFLSVRQCWNLPAFAHFCAFIRQWESIRVVRLILPLLPQDRSDCFLFELLSCTTEFGSPDNSQTPTGNILVGSCLQNSEYVGQIDLVGRSAHALFDVK